MRSEANNMQPSVVQHEPKVSIIMPVYNGERFIVDAIESALVQTYTNFEVIIVDDGSQDRSHDKIEPYLALPNIRYIRQKNGGVAAARNAAIACASGELIGFLDQDDVWAPHKLEREVRYLAEHPAVGLVHAYQGYIDRAGKEITNPKDWVAPLEGACFAELFQRNRIAVLTVLLRKRCLEELGVFNENIPGADDYELWLRLARRFEFGFVPDVLAYYRIHQDNVSHNAFKMTTRELQALESVLARDHSVQAELGSRTVNRRLYPLNRGVAEWSMWQEQNFEKARGFFRKALGQNWRHWPSWKGFFWCSLTPSQRRAWTWYGRRLKVFGSGKRAG
jgi:glycosyltransferase involved in cell wall biosynthesis